MSFVSLFISAPHFMYIKGEPTEMDARPPPGGVRSQRKTLLPGGPGTPFAEGPGTFPEE